MLWNALYISTSNSDGRTLWAGNTGWKWKNKEVGSNFFTITGFNFPDHVPPCHNLILNDWFQVPHWTTDMCNCSFCLSATFWNFFNQTGQIYQRHLSFQWQWNVSKILIYKIYLWTDMFSHVVLSYAWDKTSLSTLMITSFIRKLNDGVS